MLIFNYLKNSKKRLPVSLVPCPILKPILSLAKRSNRLLYSILIATLSFLYTTNFSLSASTEPEQKRYERFKAESFFYQKRYPEAIEVLKNLLKKYPSDPELELYLSKSKALYLEFKTWYQRAEWLLDENRFNHALQALREAEKVYPFFSQIKPLERKILSKQSSHDPIAELTPAQTVLFRKHQNTGQKKLNAGDNLGALQAFASALQIVPRASLALEGYNVSQKRFLAGQGIGKIKQLLAEARRYMAQKAWFNAYVKYRAVLALDPINIEAIEKLKELEDIIRQEKLSIQRKTLAKQYRLTGKNFVTRKKFAKGIEQYQLGQNTGPKHTNWDALIKEARELQEIENEKLRRKLNQRIETNYSRGLAFTASEKYVDAIAAFQQVITDATTLQRVATAEQAKELLGKVTTAATQKDEEEVNKESPYFDLIESIKALGLKALENGNYTEAKKYFEQILDLFPYNRFANQYLAVSKIKINPGTKEQVLKTFMNDANLAVRAQQYLKARSTLEIVLFIDKNHEPALTLKERLKNITNILKSSASDEQIENLWTQALQAQTQNDSKKAISLASEILRLDPANINARTLLNRLETGKIIQTNIVNIPAPAQKAYTEGIIFYNTGALEKAIQSFQRAIKIFPNYRKAAIALRKCQQYLGNR